MDRKSLEEFLHLLESRKVKDWPTLDLGKFPDYAHIREGILFGIAKPPRPQMTLQAAEASVNCFFQFYIDADAKPRPARMCKQRHPHIKRVCYNACIWSDGKVRRCKAKSCNRFHPHTEQITALKALLKSQGDAGPSTPK